MATQTELFILFLSAQIVAISTLGAAVHLAKISAYIKRLVDIAEKDEIKKKFL
jgi:hypothetical protein